MPLTTTASGVYVHDGEVYAVFETSRGFSQIPTGLEAGDVDEEP